MGYKSRGNYSVGICLKQCANREIDGKCEDCFKFSNYRPVEGIGKVKTHNKTVKELNPNG